MLKIKIHPLTYFILLSLLLCGYFNYFLIISFILLFHDLGHILVMQLYKIKINNISILPFGSVINSEVRYNLNSNIVLLISIAGILMQLILYLVFYLLFNIGVINDISYNIFLTYNRLIILFNIMPIIPLDGSKILLSIIERFMPYKMCLIIVNIISLISIILFIIFNKISLNLLQISIFLFLKTYQEILEHNFIYHKFLLERYLISNQNHKIKHIRNIKNIYKNKFNFINNENENKFLTKLFDNKYYF